ncbi:hypothetical protein [Pseudomonas sp. Marseille-Q5115]|uniref:hypothetical protein n=1 Tax=Pseudomonas sp. Marseille-Q5115 TaxID=2866593 RepID=UPI001CE455CD|nr:hypothetical protein [Pseudomonas sp. Marseille-Q5115]
MAKAIPQISDRHIATIVRFAAGEQWDVPEKRALAQDIANMLKDLSICGYNEYHLPSFNEPGYQGAGPLAFGVCAIPADVALVSPVEVLKLIGTYEVTAEEGGGYREELGACELRDIAQLALSMLPGFDAAPASL